LNATSFKALGTLTQLEILKIGPYEKHSCEKMEGSLFKEFLSKMTNLRALTLFKFDGDIKIEWFSKLKHLNSLRLKICHFYSDYSALTSLTNLTDLELSGIQFDFDNKDKGLLKLFKKVTY
jgi:Leucine-rich repeat (LRR) protein